MTDEDLRAGLRHKLVLRGRRGLLRLVNLAWPGHPTNWRDVPARLRPTMLMTLRLTTGSVLAYLLTLIVSGGKVDITGALTALLVMQASAYSTLRMGIVRVGAVLGGVLVATLLSYWVGLSWWSLALAVGLSLILSKILRLGEQAIEMPISAMLILAVSDPAIAAETRVLNTLIGAGVGVTFNLLYPPALPVRPAGDSIRAVASSISDPLRHAAEGMRAGPITRLQVGGWMDGLRLATRRVDRASEAVERLKDSRRLNPRALGTSDVEPVLASGLGNLEGCLLAVQALFTVMRTEVPTGDTPEDPYGAELRDAFAVVLDDLADSVTGFGDLVIAEAASREEEVEHRLDHTLDVLRETKAILAELITVQPGGDGSSWLLRGSILAAIEHVLAQLDLEERARARREWHESQARRATAHLPTVVQVVLPHPELPYSRGVVDAMTALRGLGNGGKSSQDDAEEASEPEVTPAGDHVDPR